MSTIRSRKIISALLVAIMTLGTILFSAGEVNAVSPGCDVKTRKLTLGKDYYDTLPSFSNTTLHERHYFYEFRTINHPGIKYKLTVTYNGDATDSAMNSYDVMFRDSNAFSDYFAEGNEIKPDDGYLFGYVSTYQEIDDTTVKESFSKLKPNRKYYVEIESQYNDTDLDYIVNVTSSVIKPSVPKIKSIKGKKKSIKMSFYKAKYAERYQIRIKKGNGKWQVYNNGKKLNRTISKLKKGKTYKIQIRAQRQYKGKWYSSSWTKAKKIRTK